MNFVSRDEVEGDIENRFKTKQRQVLENAPLRFQRQHQATPAHAHAQAVNISRVTVNCFPFDVIVFAMWSAYGI